ncbi:unnamed protein product [Cochlearia groenlandica]
MPCLDTQYLNFTSLIGAFLNLFVAYLLLCTSLFIHLVLRFLGFLGLPLPRFHNGRFGDYANLKRCLQGDLINYATERISAVDRSIKSKIPFGSITSDDDTNRFVEMKLVRKNNGDVSNARVKDETEDLPGNDQNGINSNGLNVMTVQGGKGKRFVTRRSRNHRRGGRADSQSLRSISSTQAFDETIKKNLMQSCDGFIRAKDERCSGSVKAREKTSLFLWPELEKVKHEEQTFVGKAEDNNNYVRALQESLREERAARAAVCVELDKERSAASSAADEAMAMIHRLQDEKATIEMESMQFKRMVEEKSTFDAEEMVILKDILIRREREKHFLEKEVEAYRDLLVEPVEFEEKNLAEENKQNQDSQEKRALLVQEVKVPVLDMYKSDSEVAYSHVRDVYMVKEETENNGKKKKNTQESSVLKTEDQESGIIVTGIARKLPPLCRPRKKSLSSSGNRRKSMSAVDYERLKIENEVELLRERLKTVQEEREELTRRTSLPPLSSKVRATTEKRGWRRSSMDLHSS